MFVLGLLLMVITVLVHFRHRTSMSRQIWVATLNILFSMSFPERLSSPSHPSLKIQQGSKLEIHRSGVMGQALTVATMWQCPVGLRGVRIVVRVIHR